MKTWVKEAIVVGATLLIVTVLTGTRAADWVMAGGVFFTFTHFQVAIRLMEAEERRQLNEVHCHRWLWIYTIAKESLWTIGFVLLQSWPSLVGVAIFLVYPIYRQKRAARRQRAMEV